MNSGQVLVSISKLSFCSWLSLLSYVAILNFILFQQSNLVEAVDSTGFLAKLWYPSDRHRNFYECPPGFRSGPGRFCFFITRDIGYIEDGRKTCQKQGRFAELGMVRINDEMNFLLYMLKTYPREKLTTYVFMGAERTMIWDDMNMFSSRDGVLFSEDNFVVRWASDQPQRFTERCLCMHTDTGLHYDTECDYGGRGAQFNAVCDAPKRDICKTGHYCKQVCIQKDYYEAYCECKPGYNKVNETECEDIDECKLGINLCDQICTNTIGDFVCSCREGYSYNYTANECQDVNECEDPIEYGGLLLKCDNLQGSFALDPSCGDEMRVLDGDECRLRDNKYIPVLITSVVGSTVGFLLVAAVVVIIKMKSDATVSTDDEEVEVAEEADAEPDKEPDATDDQVPVEMEVDVVDGSFV